MKLVAFTSLPMRTVTFFVLLVGCIPENTPEFVSVEVDNYPAFWSDELNLRSVAVATLKNDTLTRGAERVLAEKIAHRLLGNGSYQVLHRSREAFADDARVVSRERALGEVDAVLVGTLHVYEALRRERTGYTHETFYRTESCWQEGGWYYAEGRWYYAEGEWYQAEGHWYQAEGHWYQEEGRWYQAEGHWYPCTVSYTEQVPYRYTEDGAIVGAMLRLIDVRSGKVLHSSTLNAERWTTHLLSEKYFEESMDKLVASLEKEMAITPQTLRIHKDSLRTAHEFQKGSWQWSDTFKRNAQQLHVVLALPSAAHLNSFRIELVRKGEHEVLASQALVWNKKDTQAGYVFSPRDIGLGAGDYRVQLYSRGEVVLTHNFKLE